jgi:hypothetical protein
MIQGTCHVINADDLIVINLRPLEVVATTLRVQYPSQHTDHARSC